MYTKEEDKKVYTLYKIAINSMFNLPELFTKEQWKTEIEENDVIVKDIDILINLFLEKEILDTTDRKLFKISVIKAFNYSEQ